jgi:hypothetical protein
MAQSNYGEANKGSRYHLQKYVNNSQKLLNNMIIASSPSLMAFGARQNSIEWKSPIKDNPESKPYYEYRDNFLRPLGLENNENVDKLHTFWPKNGPQWDGLAIVGSDDNQKGYLLLEAKAHEKETLSDMGASDENSKSKIRQAFSRIQGHMGISVNNWTSGHYQLANRLAFLYFLNIEIEVEAWLVLISFVGDNTHIATEMEEWISIYNNIFKQMGIHPNARLMDRVIIVFPPAFKE